MDDFRAGSALRAVRIRLGLRQADLASRAGVSQATVSELELGRLDGVTVGTLRRVAKALDVRIQVVTRWRGGELERLLNARHATLASAVATRLRSLGWAVAPEVSFAIYGERGSIDILAWHPPTGALLVVEVKTELIDIHETLAVLDRKTRLAPRIASQRAWPSTAVGAWLVLAEGSTNRHHVRRLEPLLKAALPSSGRTLSEWLRRPSGRIAALTFFSNTARGGRKQETIGRRRVRVVRSPASERGVTVPNAQPALEA